jgi:hypothetical protein
VEFWSIGVAGACMGAFLFLPIPIGLVALLIAAALIVRRAFGPFGAATTERLFLKVA